MSFALHFLRPWCWLALLPLPLMLFALTRGNDGRAALARLADAILLPHLISNSGARRRWALIFAALAWTLAVAALAGPTWQRAPTPLYANGATRVIALSLSSDMLAQDLKPDRMTRARYAVRDLLDAAGDARSALIAYAGDAFVVAPLTPDRQTVLNLLDALSPSVMPEPGNDAARAIDQGVSLLRQAHISGGEIVLVTDDAGRAAVAAARRARAAGVRVDVLGIGTAQGAPVPLPQGGFQHGGDGGVHVARRDDAVLLDVADAGGGRYAPLQADGSGVTAIGPPEAMQGATASAQRARLWRDGGAWLLLPLLPLAALAFRRGWLCMLALMMITPFARASSWDALWATPDQRALHALQDGDYASAGKLARDPRLRGSVEYRAGNYNTAAKQFARGDDAQSQYDLGNALAKGGKYQQAIIAYDHALRRDPHLADARVNRQAVLDWLKQHPQQQQQNGAGAQNNSSKPGQQSSSSSNQANAQQRSPSQQSAQGNKPQNGQDQVQAGSSDAQGSSSRNTDTAAGKPQSGDQHANDSGDTGTSRDEDARQRAQAQRARQALKQELAQQQARQQANGAPKPKPNGQQQRAFALGADQARDDGKLDAQQRAMLDAVPDDPGALLRRKFLLEWQRRHGQQPDDSQ